MPELTIVLFYIYKRILDLFDDEIKTIRKFLVAQNHWSILLFQVEMGTLSHS